MSERYSAVKEFSKVEMGLVDGVTRESLRRAGDYKKMKEFGNGCKYSLGELANPDSLIRNIPGLDIILEKNAIKIEKTLESFMEDPVDKSLENLEELLKLFNDYEQSKRDPRAFV